MTMPFTGEPPVQDGTDGEGLTLQYPDLQGVPLDEVRASCHPVIAASIERVRASVGGPGGDVAGFNSALSMWDGPPDP